MGDLIPNGQAIAEKRKAAGQKQATFAKLIGVSERTMRMIETENKKIPAFKLEEIAGHLKIEMTALILPTASAPSPVRENEVELRPVQTGSELHRMAKLAGEFGFDVQSCEPKTDTAAIFENVLRSVSALVHPSQYSDGFEDRDFPIIHRIAAFNHYIEELRDLNIHLLANTYLFLRSKADFHIFRLELCFATTDVKSIRVTKFPDWKEQIDDDIPF